MLTLTFMEYGIHFWLLFIKWHGVKEKRIYDEAVSSITISRKNRKTVCYVLVSLEFSAIVQYKFSVLVGTMF